MLSRGVIAFLGSGALVVLGTSVTLAVEGEKSSEEFAHALEFETDGQIPSEEGAADGWEETGWNIAGEPPSLEVAGGLMTVDTIGVGGGHDVRQPVDTSAWAQEVDPGTSYTFETRLRVTNQGGGDPGFNIWLGNGEASQTAFMMVRQEQVRWGKTTAVLHEGDNSSDFVTIRIAHDGASGFHTVWRNGIQIASELGASDVTSANNWIILVDFGGANEVAAEVDYICWDATGFFPPPGGGGDTEPPAAPTGLTAQGGIGAVALDWDTGSEDDLAGYRVHRSETAGGPYELLAEGVSTSAYVDDAAVDGTTYYYVVTALDAFGNESDPSVEVSATPGLGEERDASEFAHKLLFDEDGVLPSVEGADDGWIEGGDWVIDGSEPPSLTVTGGSVLFDTVGLASGFFVLQQPDGASAWSEEVGPSTSYTFEVAVKATGDGGSEPGVSIWLANGAGDGGRSLTRVTQTAVFAGLGTANQLHEGDNSSEFVTIRVGRDGVSGQSFVWRNGILVGDGLAGDGSDSRRSVFLIDFGRDNQCAGEFDYVCWDAAGLYPPTAVIDDTPPAAPTGLAATGGFMAVGLDWDSNTEDDLAGYNVYRADVARGPYDLLAESVVASDYGDDTAENGTTYYYVVTAVDGSGNESDPSAEASATPQDLASADASGFAHQLHFDQVGVLPSEEGAEDGWAEGGAWDINGEAPPFLIVAGGLLNWSTSGLGTGGGKAFDIHQPDGASAWSTEIDPSTSYTFEVSVRVTESDEADVPSPGMAIWLANGADRAVTLVRTDRIVWAIGGEVIHEADNASDFVSVRVVYDATSGKYFIWRNGELIGRRLVPLATDGRRAVFLIDFGSNNSSAGELDYVAWNTGAFGPSQPNLRVPGDCNQSGVLDISDILCGIDLLFAGFNLLSDGSEPPCESTEGSLGVLDVNDDAQFDISDLVYTSNYLFSGGAPPTLGTECVTIAGCATAESCVQP